jgi:isopenicillin N synthase-like dioxygenase
MVEAPPILDISPFYGSDEAAKAKLVGQVRNCCLHNGFFQIVGHRVPLELQEALLKNVKDFFALSPEDKKKVHKGMATSQIGLLKLTIRRQHNVEQRLREYRVTDPREGHQS